MCGILCTISISTSTVVQVSKYLKQLLNNRGPDAHSSLTICTENNQVITFDGNVLWQQGNGTVYQQPASIKDEHILLFNGDIFLERVDPIQSDTIWLLKELEASNNQCHLILNLFRKLQGPYSIIYYNKKLNCLYFVRDPLGRNSLLLGKDPINNQLILSSVAEKQFGVFVEVPSLGVYVYDLNENRMELCPWQDLSIHSMLSEELECFEKFLGQTLKINEIINPNWLFNSIKIKDHQFASYNFKEILDGMNKTNVTIDLFPDLLLHNNINETCNIIIDLLSLSVKQRIQTTPEFCKNCIKTRVKCVRHSKIGILFSGGIDCTILSVLASKYVHPDESIDLLNVSFEKIIRNKGKSNLIDPNHSIDFNTPDRISAKQSLKELKKICPNRIWNLVEINITRSTLHEYLTTHISNLIYPLTRILDESVGTAMWFAASGNGLCDEIGYKSPCRVVLVGSGADELFGGYTRHRNAYIRESTLTKKIISLENELLLDWIRLPRRNLARDDRCISDHGITSRAPYIEEEFSNFVRNLKPLEKCYFGLEHGIGDKLLLRLCGYKLGLKDVCALRKRAFQFGCRIADSKQNANDISSLLA